MPLLFHPNYYLLTYQSIKRKVDEIEDISDNNERLELVNNIMISSDEGVKHSTFLMRLQRLIPDSQCRKADSKVKNFIRKRGSSTGNVWWVFHSSGLFLEELISKT